MEAFSAPPNKIKTLILLAVNVLLAIVSAVTGINDNPPGVILVFLAAVAFVLAFTHPWHTAKKFLFLFLAAVGGFILFIIDSIISDSLLQTPAPRSKSETY